MASASSPEQPPISSAKIVVAGGFGVGKTTAVASVSQTAPIRTETWMTAASSDWSGSARPAPHDDPDRSPVDGVDLAADAARTPVAMDLGRLTIPGGLVLYLFGTPGQARFWPIWDDLCRDAVGALVLTDTRRLDASFAAVNYFEQDSDVPFVVCVNLFDGVLAHKLEDVREALGLSPSVPLITCDARERASVARALLAVVDHAMRHASAGGAARGTGRSMSTLHQEVQVPCERS